MSNKTSDSIVAMLSNLSFPKELIEEIKKEKNPYEHLKFMLEGDKPLSNRFLLITSHTPAAFQLARILGIPNLCFINPMEEIEGYAKKIAIGYGGSGQKTQIRLVKQDCQEPCIFVSQQNDINVSLPIIKIFGDEGKADYYFVYNTPCAHRDPEIQKNNVKLICQSINNRKIIGYSKTSSIYDGFTNGIRLFHVGRTPRSKNLKLSNHDIEAAFRGGSFKVHHIVAVMNMFGSYKGTLSAFGVSNEKMDGFSVIAKQFNTVVNSMTTKEKNNPLIIMNNSSCIERVAKGCGLPAEKVKNTLSQLLNLINLFKNPRAMEEFAKLAQDPSKLQKLISATGMNTNSFKA